MYTGANVNILPLEEYIKITGESEKECIIKSKATNITEFWDK